MKRLISALALFLFCALSLPAQNSTSFTVTVVAPPSCTVTLSSNPVSTSGANLYAGQAGVINFNISACSIASATATATWDGTSTPTTFKTSPAALSVAITAGQATVGTHTLVLTIPQPVLAMNSPVTLPNASPGKAYSANLAAAANLTGGIPPYTFSLTSGSLPSGLTLSSNGTITGIPSLAGSFTFGFTVKDSSGVALRKG